MPQSTLARSSAADDDTSESSFSWRNLRYYLLIFLAINTVTSFFKQKADTQGQVSNPAEGLRDGSSDASALFKLKPDLKNLSFANIKKPEKPFESIYDADENLVRNVANIEQVIYENSLKDPCFLAPLYDDTTLFDFEVYVNDIENFDRLHAEKSIFKLDGVKINDIGSITTSLKIDITDNVKNNGTLFLHAFIAEHSHELFGYKKFQLNRYFPKKKQAKLHKLIGSEESGEKTKPFTQDPSKESSIIASYWHPNVTLILTSLSDVIETQSIPHSLVDVFPIDPRNQRDKMTGLVAQYFPPIYQNKFWQLKDHMIEINSTVESLELNLKVETSGFWKIQALVIITDGMKQQQEQISSIGGGVISDGSELDSIKKILLDTNPYLLAITIVISILHSLLEFLAFRSDISHWRNKKNNVGVSVRSIVANVIQQLITLLYLVDNSDGTSYMILASQGFGILVEAWKITTIVKIEIRKEPNNIIPKLLITDRYELSDSEVKTQEYDSIAFKYLYLVAAPLLLAYSGYRLLYKEHKSWYSFLVSTLVGFVYSYGFLTLVPSVYINYRLKSVAHVPKKAMAYKVVNTFIDDLFAFVIKMPWLHRLATLRDDVIFFIYLYQTWIYRVDYTRVNEFGQGGDDDQGQAVDEETKKIKDKNEEIESEQKPVEKEKKKNK